MYDRVVADPRNPSGRRPPALPLPPPPDTDEPPSTGPTQVTRRRRSPSKDVAHDLPRLPEVALHEESNEVDLDPRALAPATGSLSGARVETMSPSRAVVFTISSSVCAVSRRCIPLR